MRWHGLPGPFDALVSGSVSMFWEWPHGSGKTDEYGIRRNHSSKVCESIQDKNDVVDRDLVGEHSDFMVLKTQFQNRKDGEVKVHIACNAMQ